MVIAQNNGDGYWIKYADGDFVMNKLMKFYNAQKWDSINNQLCHLPKFLNGTTSIQSKDSLELMYKKYGRIKSFKSSDWSEMADNLEEYFLSFHCQIVFTNSTHYFGVKIIKDGLKITRFYLKDGSVKKGK